MKKNNMNITLAQVKMLNSLIMLGFFAIMIVAVVEGFVIHSISKQQKMTLVPAGFNHEMTLTSQSPDNKYLIAVSKDILSSKLNVTPFTVRKSFDWLLTYVSSASYPALSEELKKEAKKIKEADMSASFYPTDWQVNNDKLEVLVTGVMKKYVGKRMLPSTQESYLIKYSYPNGFIRLQSVDKVKVKN
jgi:conjugal transfer pilus assembly protein TraE